MDVDVSASILNINSKFAGNPYFSAMSDNVSIEGLAILNPFVRLKPQGSGLIDILNNHTWSNGGNKDEVPSVVVTEFELDFGIWQQNLTNIYNVTQDFLNGRNVDTYLNLYAAKHTGFKYNLPWLVNNSNIRSISNSWGNMSGGIADMLGGITKGGPLTNFLGAIAGAYVKTEAAGVGFEEVQEYKQTNTQEITITFPLYNTTSIESAYLNYIFVQLFNFQNLKTRTSFMTFIPPKLYTVDSVALGGIYWPVAYVSNFSIDSIGTLRNLSEFSGFGTPNILIPEAYKVSITFKEILQQSSNIFAGTMGGQKVEVTNLPKPASNPSFGGGNFNNNLQSSIGGPITPYTPQIKLSPQAQALSQ